MTEQMNLGMPPVNVANQQYIFPCYWGGATTSPTPPKIHAKLKELRLLVGGVSAKKANGVMFPVKGAKEVAQKLAQALVDLNMVAPVISQDVHFYDTKDIPQNQTASGKPVFRTLVHVKATVRIGAEDGSYVDMVGSGHGGDTDDKAGGKASTYAWKDAILKGVTVPEQDMMDTDDEQQSAEPAPKPTPGPKKSAAPATEPIVDAPSGVVDKLEARIELADDETLEFIREEIKSGKHDLSPTDKLRVSAKFLARKKFNETAKKETE